MRRIFEIFLFFAFMPLWLPMLIILVSAGIAWNYHQALSNWYEGN
jgi:hypothetical protein